MAVRHYARPVRPGYQRPFTRLHRQLSFKPTLSGSDRHCPFRPTRPGVGVPQGSVLSVTLFSLKINSVANSIPRGVTCSMYVDDLLVCYSGKNMATIERQLQLCLNKVHEWSVANGFKFSKSKTVCMDFCHLRTLHPDPSLTMDGDPIKVVKEMRFLGLVFDSKLSFLPHIRALKARCLKALDVEDIKEEDVSQNMDNIRENSASGWLNIARKWQLKLQTSDDFIWNTKLFHPYCSFDDKITLRSSFRYSFSG